MPLWVRAVWFYHCLHATWINLDQLGIFMISLFLFGLRLGWRIWNCPAQMLAYQCMACWEIGESDERMCARSRATSLHVRAWSWLDINWSHTTLCWFCMFLCNSMLCACELRCAHYLDSLITWKGPTWGPDGHLLHPPSNAQQRPAMPSPLKSPSWGWCAIWAI